MILIEFGYPVRWDWEMGHQLDKQLYVSDVFIYHLAEADLSAACTVRVTDTLRELHDFGFTALSLRKLVWLDENHFELQITAKPFDVNLSNGVTMQGFVDERFDKKRICLTCFRTISGSRDIHIFTNTVIREPILRAAEDATFRPLDDYWLKKASANPFAYKSLRNLEMPRNKMPVNRPMSMLSFFYKTIDDIKNYQHAARQHGFSGHLDSDIVNGLVKIKEFDGSQGGKGKEPCLRRYIEEIQSRNTFTIITFIDHTDVLSIAQAEFMRLLSLSIRIQYPQLDMELIDVSICDENGVDVHREDYEFYHSQNRFSDPKDIAPFSMIYGRIHEALRSEQYKLPLPDSYRWLDIDIFDKCRSSSIINDARMACNLRAASGAIMRAAGMMDGTQAMVEIKDLSYLPEDRFQEAIKSMNEYSALIIAHKDLPQEDLQSLVDHCAAMMLTGIPYVTIVKTENLKAGTYAIPLGVKAQSRIILEDISDYLSFFDALNDAYDSTPYLGSLLSGKLHA